MRGNWDQLEPRTLAPEQDQQLQQSMLGGHPEQKAQAPQQQKQAAPTTPGWINDRIVVKEEPADDKNNDSGISPGHYTSDSASPQSRHSPTMTANCSLSPGSTVSHDSNVVQMNGYSYSPQSISPPMDFQATLDYAHASIVGEQASGQQPTSSKPVNEEEATSRSVLGFDLPEELEFTPEPLHCPVCSYASRRRIGFSEHLKSHCSVAARMCEANEFNRSVLKQLLNGSNIGNLDNRASPNLEDCCDLDNSELGLRVPRVNPQGKVKIFRCKQCAFVAMTKVDFWDHSREHIKLEKLLTCPRCPFVTEYKHHLEYHLRNHFGSKPYKCDKCNYSCVNKSMLNSHLKSHSNIYQFRCSDCSYATKYCHSLKLHLRKYEHKPAMVLNADGSPNPLPIIDVYGTRRGPKAKPKKDEQTQQASTTTTTTSSSSNVVPTVVPVQQQQQASPLGGAIPQFQFNPMNGITGMGKINGFQGFTGQAMPATPALLGFPYNPIFTGFPMTNPFAAVSAPAEESPEKQMERIQANFVEYAKSLLPDTKEPVANYEPIKQEKPDSAGVLDLSKPEGAAPVAAPVNSPKASGTSRRKGRAVKLDRRLIANDSDEDMPEEASERFEVRPPSSSPASSSGDSKDFSVGMSNEFTCQYCEISFGNEVMHSVHMGYHGYQNPYTCNMCGVQCTDKVSFFLHIARVKH